MTVQVQSGLARKEAPTASAMASALAPERSLERGGRRWAVAGAYGGGRRQGGAGDKRSEILAWCDGDQRLSCRVGGLCAKGSALAGKGGKRLIVDLAENLREASPTKMYLPPEKATRPVKQ